MSTGKSIGKTWSNWAGNQSCVPAISAAPATEDQITELIDLANSRNLTLRVAGAGHSFTGAVPTDGMLLTLDRFNRPLDHDPETGRVTVQAGMRLHELNDHLASLGLALPNLGDIAYQSVAGALATATHGTGRTKQNLSAAVVGMRFIGADAEPIDVTIEEQPDLLRALRVSIGALGLISTVTLQCVPAFNLHAVEASAPLDEVLENLDSLTQENEFFEFYWVPGTRTALTKANNTTEAPAGGRTRWERFRDEELSDNLALGVFQRVVARRPDLIRAAAKRLPDTANRDYIDRSDLVFTSPRRVRFREMEYAIPLEHLTDAFSEVRALIPTLDQRVTFPIEVRTCAADDAYLSTANGRPTGYIAVHLLNTIDPTTYFQAVESIMNQFGGRPHWGKMHYQDATSLAERYPDWERFATLRREHDPEGLFTNPYIERVLGPAK